MDLGASSRAAKAAISLVEQASAEVQVSGYLVRALLEVSQSHGVGAEDLLGQAAASSYALLADRWLSLGEYQRLLQRAIQLTRTPALGIECGLSSTQSSFGLMSPLVSHARTLRDAVGLVTRFHALISEAINLEVHERSDSTLLVCTHPREVGPSMAELIVAGMVNLLQTYHCVGSDVRAVCFQHKHPAHYSAYELAFHGTQRFAQSYTGVEISSQAMDRPSVLWQPALQAYAHAQAEQSLEQIRREPTFTERVQALLGAHAGNEPPSMVEVAKTLGVSERSLRRRLELEGKSYRELVQDATFERACAMLKDPGQTLKKIAYTLGYSCHASFHRAFSRWAATTPHTYREDRTVRSTTRHGVLQRRATRADASATQRAATPETP